MSKTDQTTWVMGEEYILHECDNCEDVLHGTPFAYWPNRDFTLCMVCIIGFSKPSRGESKVEFKLTKAKIPSAIRWAVWERDNFTCQYCGSRKNLTIDHIHTETHGGGLEKSNLVTACHSCNSSKGARTPEEAGMPLLFDPRATGDD